MQILFISYDRDGVVFYIEDPLAKVVLTSDFIKGTLADIGYKIIKILEVHPAVRTIKIDRTEEGKSLEKIIKETFNNIQIEGCDFREM